MAVLIFGGDSSSSSSGNINVRVGKGLSGGSITLAGGAADTLTGGSIIMTGGSGVRTSVNPLLLEVQMPARLVLVA